MSWPRSPLLERHIVAAGGLCAAILWAGCGNSGQTAPGDRDPLPPSLVAEFSVLPVQMPEGATITPLGHLQPVGHVLPTDHVYFYATNIDHPLETDTTTRTVYAPGDGVITWMLYVPSGRPDWKVMFRMTETFYYYLDHVLVDPALKVGSVVRAGDVVGTTGPGGSLDLGAYDTSKTLSGFLVPERYPMQTLHCVSPWKYFVEPLRTSLYARIRRPKGTTDLDGRIDYDVAGRLVGNWFHESVPKSVTASGPEGWPKSLAFVYDEYDPALVRISIGGTLAAPHVWAIPLDAPRPKDVSVESGPIAYRLMRAESAPEQAGLMLVQLLAPDQIRVQVFEGDTRPTADFDARAQVYSR